MEKFIKSVILSALFLALASAGTVWAEEVLPDLSIMGSASADELSMDAEPQIPGRIESTGLYFGVKDSEWLNVSLSSSELIKLTLESVPNMITMQVEPAGGAASAQITIGGLTPDTTYHKYEDNYHNHEAFTTDDNGNYTYTQDLFIPHMVFIQTHKSTKFIKDDGTGGDCYSIGIWDSSTKTCTVTIDLNETIQIDSNGVTLDGNGHTLTGSDTGYGVYLSGRTGVTVKNFNISRFSSGIYLYYSNSNSIISNIASINSTGIHLLKSNGNSLTWNTISDSKGSPLIYSPFSNGAGIYLSGSSDNTISDNIASNNPRGILLDGWSWGYNNNNLLTGNKVLNNIAIGIYLFHRSSNNVLINNIVNNTTNPYVTGLGSGTGIALYLVEGSMIELKGNTMVGNRYNFALIKPSDKMKINIDTSNTVDGKPIYFVTDASNQVFDASTNAGTFYCFNCNNVTIEGLYLSKNYRGLYLFNTQNSIIRNNTISNNYYGIYIYNNSNNTIYNNNFLNNYSQAIVIGSSSNIFNLPAPTGGNYWSDWTAPDADGDGFVDNPYVFTGGQDNLPWIKPNGWKPSDSTPPTTRALLSGTSGNNGWYLSDVQVTLTAADNEGGSGVAKTEYSFDGTNWTAYYAPFMVSTEGATTVYYKSADSAGNAEAVKSLTVSIDKTPPTITGTATTSPNANGWYNTDVTVTFTCTDGTSGIAQCPSPSTMNSEGAGQVVSGTAVDNAGNSATASVTLNIDKTPPSITGAATTSPNANGWYSTDVAVHFTASDNMSGINTVTPDITISTEGANQSISGTVFDMAGNSASAAVSGINIDKTAPVITITSPMAAQYDHSATINVSFTATDSVSGVFKNTVSLDGQQYDPANPISLLYLSLGTHTLRVESENYAGLTAAQSVDFEIIATAGGTTSLITTLYQTGAIDSAGIANSLTQKLEAVQAAISSNQTVSAKNILEAFINMLEAQSGKHISSSAADLLIADALYMVGQL